MIGLVRLNLRRWRAHRARTALSLVGIAVGVALVVAVVAVYGSMTTSIERATSGLAGSADIEVGGLTDSGFDAGLLDAIGAVPGVQKAIPLVRSTVVIARQETLLFGFDQRAADLAPRLGAGSTNLRDPKTQELVRALAAGQLVAGRGLARLAGLHTGTPADVTSSAGTATAPLGDVLDGGAAMRINRGVFAVAALPVAQRLAGKPGRLDSVLVVAAPHTDTASLQRRLEQVVAGRASVASPKLRAEQAQASTKTLQQGLMMSAVMALVVGGFLVFNTMNMAALERRRELATMRAMGGRRGNLLRAFLGEAAVLGLLGSAVGAAIGVIAARKLVSALPQYIVSSFGVRVSFVMPTSAVPLALAAGVGATLAAAWLPARRALMVAPVEAMRPEGVLETSGEGDGIALWPTVAGVALFGGGVLVALVGPSTAAMAGLGLTLVGGPILLYGLSGPLVRGVGAVARRFGPAGHLAAESIGRAPRRAWATASAVMLTVGMVVAQTGITHDAKRSVQENLAPLSRTDLYVSTASNANFSSSVLFPPDVEATVRALPGVGRVAGSQFAFATLGRDRVMLQGVEDGILDPSLTLVSERARPALLAGTGVVVSTRFGELHHLAVGDILTLPTPTGPQRLPIADEIESFKWDKGLVVTSLPAIEQWFGRTGVGDLYVQVAPGANKFAVRHTVESYTRTLPFQTTVETGDEFLASIAAASNQVMGAFVAMEWVIIAAALLAVLNALLIAVIERRRELGILRAIGTGRKMLRNMVVTEAGAIGVVAGVAGLVIGGVMHYAALGSVAQSAGFPLHYRFTPIPMVMAVLAGALVTMLGSALPARRAARINVIEAIGYE